MVAIEGEETEGTSTGTAATRAVADATLTSFAASASTPTTATTDAAADDSAAAPAAPTTAPVATADVNNTTGSEAVDGSEKRKKRRSNSVAHDDIVNKTVVYFSYDIEHAGETAGPVQISCKAYDADFNTLGVFNEFVRPTCSADDWLVEAHLIRPDQDRIKNADEITDVFPRWVEFIEGHLDGGTKQGVLVAWEGNSCDIDWLYKLTEEKYRGKLRMPSHCPYFMDPKYVIKKYTGCKLTEEKRAAEAKKNGTTTPVGYGLGVLYCYVTGKEELDGAHDALVDCEAQMKVVTDKRFLPYMDKANSILTFDEMWAAKRKRRAKVLEETTRPTPTGWEDNSKKSWKVPWAHSYSGQCGGPNHGPTSELTTHLQSEGSLMDWLGKLLMFYFTILPCLLQGRKGQASYLIVARD